MRRLAVLLVALSACATSEGGLPRHAPPFSTDRPIVWPQARTGHLVVTAIPRPASSTRPAGYGAWRLYDVNGRPVGPIEHESRDLDLPPGEYVVMSRGAHGHTRSVQFVVRAQSTTDLPLPSASLPEASATDAEE